jgi:hypothetical protein
MQPTVERLGSRMSAPESVIDQRFEEVLFRPFIVIFQAALERSPDKLA